MPLSQTHNTQPNHPKSPRSLKLHWYRDVSSGLTACGALCLTSRSLHNVSSLVLKQKLTCKKCLALVNKTATVTVLNLAQNKQSEAYLKELSYEILL